VIGSSTQSFSITIAAVIPGAPTIGAATGGNNQASVSFTAPAFTGGAAITSYTATCGGFSATGAGSPIVVGGLTNNVSYSCSVRATNSAGTGPASGTVSVVPTSGIPLAVTGVVSRKTHGAFGTWDIAIDNSQPIAGAVSVDPRAIGAGHKIVFSFNDNVAAAGTAACVDAANAPVGSASAVAVGTTVEVTLTGVPDNKRVTVSLSGVNGGTNVGASMGFLVGDVNGNRSVTSADILAVKGRDGQNVNAGNFRYDVNVSGNISLTDAVLTHGNAGLTLP
jgi:hypothetical protein